MHEFVAYPFEEILALALLVAVENRVMLDEHDARKKKMEEDQRKAKARR